MIQLDDSSMVLTSSNVKSVFMQCLFTEGEDMSDPAIGEGIINSFGFHKGRLEEHRQDIKDMLDDLPAEFASSADGGGGWSFLNACMDKEGNQWGEQANAEQLLALGLATEQAVLLIPKSLWSVFPSGLGSFRVLQSTTPALITQERSNEH